MLKAIVVLSVIPGLVLIIQNGIRLQTSTALLNERILVKEKVQFTLEIGRMLHRTQTERGMMALYVSSNRDPSLEERLAEVYSQTDDVLNALSEWKHTDLSAKFQSKAKYHESVRHFRNQTDHLTHDEVVDFFTFDNAVFVDWMVEAVKDQKNSNLWAEIVAFHMFVNGKESTGIQRGIGAYFFTTGIISLDNLMRYKARYELGIEYFRHFKSYSAVAEQFMSTYIVEELEENVNRMRSEILRNRTGGASLERGKSWVANMTEYIDELQEVNQAMTNYLTAKTEEEILKYKLELVLNIVILVLTIVSVPLISFLIYKMALKMHIIRNNLQLKTLDLEKEKKRTEYLLAQLKPAKIARNIYDKSVEPQKLTCITVLFSDICDFLSLLSNGSPSELIEMVNSVFDILDRRIYHHHISKIGSIGNVSVLADGINPVSPFDHAAQMANFALDVMDRIRLLQVKPLLGNTVKLKIGISTGPVVSGLVSGKLPRYCLYGKTMTDAKYMLDTSSSLKIHVSQSTYDELTTKHSNFILLEREDNIYRSCSYVSKSYWLVGNADTTVVQLDITGDTELV